MKKSSARFQIIGFIFTSIAGTLLHFLYDWTNQSILTAPFSAVNESTWEHMKLLFFPLFIYTIYEYGKIGRKYSGFMCVKLIGTLTGLVLIPAIYYTYTGALGITADWFNISIYYIVAAAVYFLEYTLLKNQQPGGRFANASFVILCIIGLLFVVFTFVQPEIPLFRDPATGQYGIEHI